MDTAEKRTRLEDLRRDSRERIQALGRAGVGEFSLAGVRVELLIEHLLPWDDGKNEARLDFELAWEEKANSLLRDMGEQLNRAKLMQGIIPGVNGHG